MCGNFTLKHDFNIFLKLMIVSTFCIWREMLLQKWTALTEKAGWRKDRFLRWTNRLLEEADLLCLLLRFKNLKSGGGTMPCKILNTRIASSKLTNWKQMFANGLFWRNTKIINLLLLMTSEIYWKAEILRMWIISNLNKASKIHLLSIYLSIHLIIFCCTFN